jgi:CHAT domain-containing protein/tetratricopeptide (TPR) repeat protein
MVEESETQTPKLDLKSSTSSWKREMLDRLTGEPSRPASLKRIVFNYGWGLAAAAVFAAVVIAGSSASSMLWLLARSSDRTFEFRFAGAPYRTVTVQRGGSVSEGPLFLLTKLLIALRSTVAAEGPAWMHVRGREALLERGGPDRTDTAIQDLESARAADPEDAGIANDLAVAYLLRSTTEDLARGKEILGTLAERQPNANLLFNLALAYETSREYNKALETWDRFLKIEPSGGWADEAKQHKDAIRRRQQGRVNTRTRRSEDAVITLAAQGFRSSTDLDVRAISEEMAAAHDDPWLKELLSNLDGAATTSDIRLLQDAVKALSAGNISAGETQMRQALAAFAKSGNRPAEDFAALELTYALQKLSKADECIAITRSRLPALARRRYHWLEIEMTWRLAACEAIAKLFEPAYETAMAARNGAISAKYSSLEFLALGAESAVLREVGSYREALAVDAQAIDRYWSGEGTRNNAYQSHYGLAMSLDGLRYPHAAAASLGEAVRLAEVLPDRTQEAMARARYAEVLIATGRTSEAAAELSRSETIFQTVPSSPSALLYHAYTRLSQAYLDGQSGEIERGLEATEDMRAIVASLENPAIETRLWHVRSELLAKAGRLAESEEALRRLLTLGDAARDSVPSSGDRSAMARRVADAVNVLADRYLGHGDAAEAWRLWTHYNAGFQNPASQTSAVRLVLAEFPSGSTALISNGTGIHAVRLAPAAEIARLNRELQLLAETPDTSLKRFRGVARRLDQLVVKPLRQYLANDQPVFIAATPPFSGIPFAALVEEDGSWLADRYQIAYAPLDGSGRVAASARITPDMRLLGVSYLRAGDVMGRRLPPLASETDLEVDAAAQVFPRHVMLKDKDADPGSVLRELAGANVFQFSGHAITSADSAALVLAPGDGAESKGRLLWASDLSPDVLKNLRLAVLAACSTGRAADDSHYPGADMAQAFLLAGVPLVLASNWDVDSLATGKLIRSFYDGIRAGLTPERAASDAAATLRRQPGYAHPYYWAAFALYRG